MCGGDARTTNPGHGRGAGDFSGHGRGHGRGQVASIHPIDPRAANSEFRIPNSEFRTCFRVSVVPMIVLHAEDKHQEAKPQHQQAAGLAREPAETATIHFTEL